jgi:hypothetical protein
VLGSLAILAALAMALALAGAGEEKATPAGGDRLDPDVALRVSATDPARTLPQLEREPGRKLLARLSFVAITPERSCPPPAILACRPAFRLVGRLRGEPEPGLQRDLAATAVAALRAAGYRRMVVGSAVRDGERVGRVTSRGETLGRWRVAGEMLEITIGPGLRPELPSPARRTGQQ